MLPLADPHVTPDGQRFLLLKDVEGAAERETARMILVKNWSEELQRFAPPAP